MLAITALAGAPAGKRHVLAVFRRCRSRLLGCFVGASRSAQLAFHGVSIGYGAAQDNAAGRSTNVTGPEKPR